VVDVAARCSQVERSMMVVGEHSAISSASRTSRRRTFTGCRRATKFRRKKVPQRGHLPLPTGATSAAHFRQYLGVVAAFGSPSKAGAGRLGSAVGASAPAARHGRTGRPARRSGRTVLAVAIVVARRFGRNEEVHSRRDRRGR
jgi:hypothetical protein